MQSNANRAIRLRARTRVQEHELQPTDGSDKQLVGRLGGAEVLPDDFAHLATALRNVSLD